ncbi:hypothetical protein ACFL5V_05770 [Fibrobacterota bacterium]
MKVSWLFLSSFFLALLLSNCITSTEDKTITIRDTVNVYVTDTLYMDPPVPGAPVITSARSYRSMGVDDNYHNYIEVDWEPVNNAIGYQVYFCRGTSDGTYAKVSTGTTSETERDGIYFTYSDTYFFKVTAINNDGVESAMSPHKAVVYDGA